MISGLGTRVAISDGRVKDTVLLSAAGEVIEHRYYFMAPYGLAVAYKWSAWTIGWSFILISPSSPLKPTIYLWMILFDL